MRNSNSAFRINADGLSGPIVEDVEIEGGDSAFVFLEATIDPNNASNPLIVEDALQVFTDGGEKSLPVVAWGQDALYIRADQQVAGIPIKILDDNTVWTKEKPIVVYGYAVVDSARSLRIEPGTQVHFHAGAALWVYRYGHIVAEGTIEEPIVFQSDRLEAFYDEIPGQWDRIWINESDKDHVLKNCVIKNSILGLQIEPAPLELNIDALTYPNKIFLENINIRNQSLTALYARNYNLRAGNVAISNTGGNSVTILGGGSYELSHFSVVNFWSQTVRSDPAFFISNSYVDPLNRQQVRQITGSFIENSVIAGSEENEFEALFFEEVSAEFEARFTAVKSEEALSGFENRNIIYQDPKLSGGNVLGWKPQAGSPLINAGLQTQYNQDILGKMRDASPDLGAYEFDPAGS
ncbi:MAG: choice-of-anchor Q domain-containing protein [Luteibaculum sp.]